MSTVPCNGCTNCCRGDAVRILPYEDPAQWHTEPHPILKGHRMLAHKPNRECVYLAEHGCSIHESKPQQCKDMDCRSIAAMIGYTRARRLNSTGALSFIVWHKGRELLRQEQGK